MDNLAGKTIKSYQLHELIGAGSFAAVYRAHQAVVDREVAIKIIWPAFANHPNFIRRFETEAQLVAGLEHPHIVPLYDYWREPDGAYIVMRWLRGGHLREAMDRGARSMTDAIQIAEQVTGALMLAHHSGIVHCDIKPENIMLDDGGNAYLADFGIAQIFSSTRNGESTTLFDTMGSPAYAAPEQMDDRAITPQVDQYSLGIILWELLAGEHPFPELEQLSQTELLTLRLNTAIPPLNMRRPDLPRAVDDVLRRATELDPANRYPDILSMVQDLRGTMQTGNGNGRRQRRRSVISDALPNPYKGLRAFQEADAHNFFGREGLIQQLLNRMRETGALSRFLALVGPSGSGKSSVVKAGLIPTLKRGAIFGSKNWFYTEMIPGSQPFEELATALNSVAAEPIDPGQLRSSPNALTKAIQQFLPDDNSELFLFVDQFEEVFTHTEDEHIRKRFLESLQNAIMAPNSRLQVVITLRADFYDRPLLHPQLSRLMRERTEVVIPLTASELEQAIVEPARRIGVSIEPGLVTAITAELKAQPGALPLLQYSLSELFARRTGNLLTVNAYNTLGGVRGALAKRADELYLRLNETQQEAARQVFLRLITLGEGTEDTRRRAPLSEIRALQHDDDVLDSVLDHLGWARLLTFDRDPVTRTPTVEVTHEALIREWQRLRHWLDESRNDVRMQLSLANLSREWEDAEQDASFLLKGSRLHQYEKWAAATSLTLTAQEHHYLQTSITEREQLAQAEQVRQQRERTLERQSVNRLRMLVFVLLGAIVLALGLSALAFNQSRIAQREWARAENALATSDASAILSQGMALEASALRIMSDSDSDLAIRLALEAASSDFPSAQSQRTLGEVALAPGTRLRLTNHTSWVTDVAISPNSNLLASSSTDATVRIWDATSGQQRHVLTGHSGDVQSVAFSPDGQTLISAASDFEAILWDVHTGQEVGRLSGHQRPVWDAAFSPDGQTAITASSDLSLILWDLASGQPIHTLTGHQAWITGVMYTADGQHALSNGRHAILWDLTSGEALQELIPINPITAIAVSPDSQIAVSGSTTGKLTLWNLDTGSIIRELDGSTSEIKSIAYHPDGNTILAGTVDGTILAWDIPTGEIRYQLTGHTDAVLSLAICKDGMQLVSGSTDQTIRVWNIGHPDHLVAYGGHTGRVTAVIYSADGSTAYTSSTDGTLRGWDVNSGQARFEAAFETPITSLAVSSDDTYALVGLRTGEILQWDIATQAVTGSLAGHSNMVTALDMDATNPYALSASQDGTLTLWDIPSGEAIQRFSGHNGTVYSAALTPDGTRALSASQDGLLILWDVATGTEVRRLAGHNGSVYSVAISPDGQTALSGASDSYVILWNLTTGREIARFAGHTAAVWDVTFSSTGDRALSGGADDQLILWDIASGSELHRYAATNTVFAIAFSPNNAQAIAGQELGTLDMWRVFTLDDLIDWTMQNRYLRELSCVERELFHITPYCD
jgi:WD40 repeat protein/serine/threonine protein kinase